MSIYTPEPILTAILGPTNTGKTHYAVERMLGRSSGCIGLPLRLLAREIYDRIVRIKGPNLCALITGEEKIIPKTAVYYVCTVEAMPTTKRFAFVAIDEIQLAAHPERGHIFTDRLLHMRGTEETLFLGAETIRPLIRELVPKARFDSRERFSTLSFAGATKLRTLPKRSVIVAFSASEVYGLAELMRRHRGGAAVVMGALSPRTRNAQAELYQSGEVDFLIATDAIGMGLNLDVDHLAFASLRKFDGRRKRFLTPMEASQIAGRAGRFRNHGTFGTTGSCTPMDEDLVGRIENHIFEPLRGLEWRNSNLNLTNIDTLRDSLNAPSPHKRLYRTSNIIDEMALDRLINDTDIADTLSNSSEVQLLWEVCQIPDFRDMGIDSHVRLLFDIYSRLVENTGHLPEDWMSRQIARLAHIDGSIETLSARLMHIRTWTYVANKASWLSDVDYWRGKTRELEDRLSDALHERLIQKFVDRRTRALMKGLGARNYMEATISETGDVSVEGHFVGKLDGLKFNIDAEASGAEAKALAAAAQQVVGPEVDRRMTSMIGAQHAIFTLQPTGEIKWGEAAIAKIGPGKSILHPSITLIGAELGQTMLQEHLAARLNDFIQTEIRVKLEPLQRLEAMTTSVDILGEARGFAFRLLELNGLMVRRGNEKIINALENNARKDVRGAGTRFGQYYVYIPELLKPAPSNLLAILHAHMEGGDGKPFIPYAGVTSIPMVEGYTEAAFNAAGYSGRGSRILRVDILNRLGDTIRQAKQESGTAKFQIAMEMMALLGASFAECQDVLRSLGYKTQIAEPHELMITQKEAPKDTSVEPASSPLPEGQTPAHDSAQAAETAPDQEAIIPATPNAVSKDGKAKLNMPSAPKPKAKKHKGPQPLNYYQPIVSTDADGNELRAPQAEVWYMPTRKFNKRPAGQNQTRTAGDKGRQGDKPRFDKRKGKKPNSDRNSGKPKYSAGSDKSRNIEDSPFAALAALKTPKKD